MGWWPYPGSAQFTLWSYWLDRQYGCINSPQMIIHNVTVEYAMKRGVWVDGVIFNLSNQYNPINLGNPFEVVLDVLPFYF